MAKDKKEFTKDDVIKLLGIKVKSIGGEIQNVKGHGTTKNEREWYIISRVDNIYTLLSEFKEEYGKRLSDHISDAERRFLTKENSYKLIVCCISIMSLIMMYLIRSN